MLADVYRLPRASWTKLRADAGLLGRLVPDDEALDLCRRVGWLAHVDDHARLRRVEALARGGVPANDVERRESLMLGYQLVNESPKLMAAEAVAPWLHARPTLCAELREVSAFLAERTALPDEVRPVADWPLVLHRHYSRREILTACGVWNERRKVPHQQGVERIQEQRRELLFVTLDKTDSGFSPSTRYRDYAISAERFHWETQNAVAAGSKRAQHYANHVRDGWQVHLFVQLRKGAPFAYVGPVVHEAQEGSRPVQIIWRLEHALPAALLSEYRTLVSG